MSVKTRLKRLEDASVKTNDGHNVAMITYDPIKQSKAEAVAEWETKNGPLSEPRIIFFTSYEPRPVT